LLSNTDRSEFSLSHIPSCFMISFSGNFDFTRFSTLHSVILAKCDITDISCLSTVLYLVITACSKIVKGLETLFSVKYLEIDHDSVQHYDEKHVHTILSRTPHVGLYDEWSYKLPDCRSLTLFYL
jgi:hypothetical protein